MMTQDIKPRKVWDTFNHKEREAVSRIFNKFLYEITTPIMTDYQSIPDQCGMQYMKVSKRPLIDEVIQ